MALYGIFGVWAPHQDIHVLYIESDPDLFSHLLIKLKDFYAPHFTSQGQQLLFCVCQSHENGKMVAYD